MLHQTAGGLEGKAPYQENRQSYGNEGQQEVDAGKPGYKCPQPAGRTVVGFYLTPKDLTDDASRRP